MRRRDIITLLGSAAAAWPLPARAQQSGRIRRIGWLSTSDSAGGVLPDRLSAFRRGLADLGWIEGRNLAFDERWANYNTERLRSLAAELTASRPELIFVASSTSLAAIRRATGTIPIVFGAVTDPVGQGFVSSLAQPGGNITGFADTEFGTATKVLQLLKTIAPAITRAIFMYDPGQPPAAGTLAELEAAAPSLGLQLSKATVRNASDIERAIVALTQTPDAGIFVQPGPMTGENQELIVRMTTLHRVPAIHKFRDFVNGGGLASYGTDDIDLCRRAASYADRILKGEKPADLPVQLPTKFRLALNLKTAKAIGLMIPESILALADDVVE
jgi:putative ABC transport system substrate-binding protein